VIPLSEPEISGNEWKYVKECLDTGWVSSAGFFAQRFEAEFAKYVGTPHAIAVANGTAGLHVALRIAGVEANDEVIVSNLSFIASANAIHYCGAHPVFADTSSLDWQIDTGKVARFLETECEIRSGVCTNKRSGRRVKAILPVHVLGSACQIDRVMDLARDFRLVVVEDAAEAVGVRYKGRHVGTFGDVGVFSFNGNKIMTAGSGGMIVTGSEKLGEYARYLTTQAKDDEVEYIHNEVGYNYRLTSLQAAMGLAQLERIEEFIARKRAIAKAYSEALSREPLTMMPVLPGIDATFWLFTVLLDSRTTLTQRKLVLESLKQQGVGARPLWHPIHALPPYQSCQSIEIEHSVDLYEHAISLPCSVGLKGEDIERCIHALQEAMRLHAVLR
jgi:perosamine synthetase